MYCTIYRNINLMAIYQGPNPCTQCLGWKRVDNHKHESWKKWGQLPGYAQIVVNLGAVHPVTCPRCNGTGEEPEGDEPSSPKEEKAKA